MKKAIKMKLSWQKRLVSFIISLPFWFKLFNRKKMPPIIGKILVIEWGYLGDTVVSTPMLKMLRHVFPLARIDLLTSAENKNYIENFPFTNRIFFIENPLHLGRQPFDMRNFYKCISSLPKEEYDLIIELSGRLTNQLFLFFMRGKFKIGQDPTGYFNYLDKRIQSQAPHQIEKNMDVIRAISTFHEKNDLANLWNPTTDEDRRKIEGFLRKEKIFDTNYVVLHAVSSWKPRQWPLERWAGVADFFAEKGWKPVFIGTSQESGDIEKIQKLMKKDDSINLTGQLTIRELIAFMEKAGLFIGSDSGPMHLASVAGLKGIVLFGPGDPEEWGYKTLHKIIYKKQACSPCPQFGFKKKCAKNFSVCTGLMAITLSDVIEKAKEILDTGDRR